MYAIRTFNFLRFDDWIKRNYYYDAVIGVYNLKIDIVGWNNSNQYLMFELKPINGKSLFTRTFTINRKSTTKDEIINWYFDTVIEFNAWWKNYINETYILSNRNDTNNILGGY